MLLYIPTGVKNLFFFLFVFLFNNFLVVGQLTADFKPDKAGGCSPLTVAFSNTTTGASAAATYQWDLGNGNTSTLPNPGGTYREEKTYTVTLTVKDGSRTSTKTHQITVYKKPVVDFSPSVTKGCVPLTVNFTSSSTAGDGTISNYFWDFGDGSNQSNTTAQQSHVYTFAQKSPVSLTVYNSHGCYDTKTKSDLIEALPGITVDFVADKTVLCKTSDAVKFRNNSTGPSDITYKWEFGDGNTSTDKEPSYTYNKKGNYTVKLTVSSAGGCSQSSEKQAYINVANFTTDFDVPALVCQNNNVTFTNKSTPSPGSSSWYVNNQFFSYGSYSAPYTFNTSGKHSVKLVNTFGTCQDEVTKDVVVKESPKMNGFIANLGGVCGAPVTVKFKDTTAGAIKWQWNFNSPYSNFTSTEKEPSFTYNSQGYYTVSLSVFDAAGCSATHYQPLNIMKPNVNIYIVRSNNNNSNSGCNNLTITFAASPATDISDYKWEFGDGGTSTDAQPEHTFGKPGTYNVKLSYTTTGGCKDVVTYYSAVTVYEKPNVDFTVVNGTTICGNTPTTFQVTSATNNFGSSWQWLIDNAPVWNSYNQNLVHQFLKDTVYTVTLIASNYGCRDTVVKKDYVKVLPPFPKIQSLTNTCDGTRGTVTFTDASRKALQWSWDFGDGNTLPLNSSQPTVKHTYTKTGTYKVVLTTINGQCTVKDSTTAYVLLKQSPQLSSTQTEVCGSDQLNIKVSNFETNPYPYNYSYYHYGISKAEYGDGTAYNGNVYSSNSYWTTTFSGYLQPLESGKKDIRIITRSTYFACEDTSNYIPLKIKGPSADFEITGNTVCYKSPTVFSDKSKGSNNVPIKKWEWSYGDGKTETFTTATNLVKYVYTNPGQFYIQLKVTDEDGCSASTSYYSKYAIVNGPKAAFYYNPTSISPNTTVSFYNNTNNYNSYSSTYKWMFKDGTTSTNYNTTKHYPVTGNDTVKLIAKNPTTGCTDTAIQVINIKNFNASFTYSSSYINNNSCPPVVVKFTNTSQNVRSVSWDFGDGSRADNQNFPSHTYYKPGEYAVTLYAKGDNGLTDSIVETIIVKGPYAKLKADVLSGCGTQAVTLNAEVKNATSFTWDFGDGSLKQTQDTFAVHTYTTPGIYTPALVLKDASGCSGTSEMIDKIVIDTLNISFNTAPQHICDSALVQFTPKIQSLAADQMQQTLGYKWNFGTGAIKDTADTRSPFFNFTQRGKYGVQFTVTSPYGCVKEVIDTIVVLQKTKGTISGPTEICEGASALFTATADMNNVSWSWSFNNGNTAVNQNPGVQTYNTPGSHPVQLIVSNNGCNDTTITTLVVHSKPAVNLSPKDATVCLGKSVQLNANGGGTYLWDNSAGLSSYNTANPFASPATNTKYVVEVTNEKGCKSKDSTIIAVARPFKLKVLADTFVCRGNSAQLYALGASSYAWINNTTGLSNTNISSPVATPTTATTYTVVGYDSHQCFTDTAIIKIGVESFPTVSAGPDLQVQTGQTIQLQATASSDVVKWNWTPADYLSCTNCQSPSSAPRTDISYIVRAENRFGCAVKDTVNIKLICSQSHVHIPTAFTPNKDRTNDVFYIKGSGMKMIKFLKIYNRTGEVVFERTNFNIDDPSAGWNGMNKGYEASPGAYVYFTEMICDTGEVFSYKGTVVLIR